MSGSAGGTVARRLLPTIPLALFLLGWARLLGQEAGLYDTRFELALMVLASIAVSVFSISATALALRKMDHTRKRAEDKIIELNAGLERTVAARTTELTLASAELVTANAALENLSLHDALTGLANRRLFDGYLATQIAVAHRQRLPLALVMCDIGYFKEYNDEEAISRATPCSVRLPMHYRSSVDGRPTWRRDMAEKSSCWFSPTRTARARA